jgi:hypothetical protein
MKTKYEAVERFSFIKKLYSKIPGSGFQKAIEGQSSPEIDACGVFFYQKYAYSTNNHIIGRILIDDNMPVEDEPLFWSYNKDDDNITRFDEDKFLLNAKNYCAPNTILSMIFNQYFLNNLDLFFNKSTDNIVYIRKNDLLSVIDKYYTARDNKKNKVLVSIATNMDTVSLNFAPVKPSVWNIPHKDTIPIFASPSTAGRVKTDGKPCSVNVLYIYEILKNSFQEYDTICLKYNSDEKVPVIISAKNLYMEKPCIFWAVAQSTV